MRSGKMLAALWSAVIVFVPGVARAAADDFHLTFPVSSTSVRYLDDYGVFAKDRIHRGIDLFAPRGTPVVAVADGFVERARYGSNAGSYVVIRHGDGWESWYLHLTGFAEGIEPGAFVEAGQLVGGVGTTGNARGTHPHLHFELHRYGRFVNPYWYLREGWQLQLVEWALESEDTPFK
ncbi:MAG: M23 family metallopeptidase [Acidimicrobiia bacterium]